MRSGHNVGQDTGQCIRADSVVRYTIDDPSVSGISLIDNTAESNTLSEIEIVSNMSWITRSSLSLDEMITCVVIVIAL